MVSVSAACSERRQIGLLCRRSALVVSVAGLSCSVCLGKTEQEGKENADVGLFCGRAIY